jgi:glycerophosphoryl diester phosphodiesterase
MDVTSQSIVDLSWNQTRVVGHRGAAAYAPENSLEAFRIAIEAKADAAECDIHMSKDGVAMVIHDATLMRTFKVEGKVADLTAAELKAIGVPTLAEYIGVLKGKCVQVHEIKAGVGVVAATVAEIRRAGTEEESIIFSFNSGFVKEAKTLAPEIYAVWLSAGKFETTGFGKMRENLTETKADAIGFQYRNVSPEITAYLRENKIPLFVWTVPPGEEVDRLKSLKVNFIITDHPRDVRAQLGL